MTALRTTILRAPLRAASCRPISLTTIARPLASFNYRPQPPHSASPLSSQIAEGAKSIVTTPQISIEASSPLGDGGPEDIAHHGINVDKPIRMDT